MARIIGEARIEGSQVVYLVRAEDPISGLVADGGGTVDLVDFLADGWTLDAELVKDGDTARILEGPDDQPPAR